MELDPQDEHEKQAGGDILGRFAQLFARPFVGADRGQAINRAVQAGVTKHVNQPIEAGLRKARVHKLISKLYEIGMRPVPHTPKLVHPILPDPAQRRAYGMWKGDDWVHTMANNPEALGVGAAGAVMYPAVPGITEGYLGAKHLLSKGLGKVKVAELATSFADELEKIADCGCDDPAEEAYWKFDALVKGHEARRKKAGLGPMDERMAFKRAVSEMQKTAQVAPYQQLTQWTCSAACLKAVLAHYGVDVPEELAVQAVGARPNRGAECNEIMWAAHKFGFDACEFSFESLEQAKWLLDQDIPIIADIQSFNHPGKGHYVVITSIDEQGVHLMDPNTPGNQRTISHEEMEARWWDRAMAPPHDDMSKWGIIILPPEGP